MSDDLSKLKAARAQLATEREALISAAIESGAAVLASVVITSHVPEPDRAAAFEEAKARKLAELRAAGEKRQVFFSGLLMDTGVPRAPGRAIGADDKSLSESKCPKCGRSNMGGFHRCEPPLATGPKLPPPRSVPDMAEAKRIMATIAPRDERDCGIVFFGSYKVEDRQVHVADQDGRSLGSLPVGPDDDVEAVARRLLREKTVASSDFFGRLDYRKKSLV